MLPIWAAPAHMAMARGKSCGSLMSNSTAWDNGTSAAPPTPCRKRNSTISGRVVAIPQSSEARVNMTIETSITLRLPNALASQPASGIMIAAATM